MCRQGKWNVQRLLWPFIPGKLFIYVNNPFRANLFLSFLQLLLWSDSVAFFLNWMPLEN